MLNASPGADLAAEVDALRAEVREEGESAREAGAGRARRISSTTQPERLPRPPLSHRLGPPTHAQVAALKEELEAKRVKEVELAAYMEVREKGRGERGERGGARRPVVGWCSRCMPFVGAPGACADAPVLLVNDRTMCSFMSDERLDALVDGLRANGGAP